jgi:DNA-binding protein H-NS
MPNLINIQNQIEKLQKQAAAIRSREIDAAVKDIRLKMQVLGITLNDLRGSKDKLSSLKKSKKIASAAQAGNPPKKRATPKVAPKFIGPGGEIWSGRGLTPRWLSALIAQGRTKDEFAI